MRPSKDKYYLDIALQVSKRATCMRNQYGSIIVSNDVIISTGYNGSPRGITNCIDMQMCVRKSAGAMKHASYELCRAVHAEANALIMADPGRLQGATLYLAGTKFGEWHSHAEPCLICKRMIVNAGITRVVINDPKGNPFELDPNEWSL